MSGIEYDDLIAMLRKAYDVMYAENMTCPWCNGHIGDEDTHHDWWCKWLEFERSTNEE